MPMRHHWLAAAFALTVAFPVKAGPARAAPGGSGRPDIVVILADDMGFSDIGCYGGEIETPTLDRLARDGIRFTQFYNTARCCPTRACLLTGLYPHQAGVGHMMSDRGLDGYRGDLNRHCVTLAEVLRAAGYATYMSGKWHVTKHTAPEGPKHNWPLQRGFDRFYGTITGAGSFYDPSTLTRDNTMISPYADPEYQPGRYYYTDAISDHAVRFVADHHREEPEKPFFMYVAFTAAHWPMHALEEDVAKYRGKYDAGYGPVRRARFERAKKLGLLDPGWDLTDQAGDWERVEHEDWEIRCMEVYAAMVDRMDQGIGRIVAELERTGRLENTLVLYLQDNGGCAEGLGRRPSGKYRERPSEPPFPPMDPEALQKQMIPPQTRDGFPTIQGPGALPGPDGTYIAYGRSWANVSNTPFREYKHWVHEGGISTPLIAHWPAGIRRRGELERQPGHLIDIMATCVDVSAARYPETFGGESIRPMEGRSLVPAFQGRAIEREAMYFEHEGNRAIRKGQWKLVAKGERGPWELYDMAADRTEMHDLAADQPERVQRLAAAWQAWAERAHVLPLGAWRGQPAKETFSKKRRFRLEAGADLARADSPNVENRAFTVHVRLEVGGADGVADGTIVAQGGSTDGWALYVADGRLSFATRHGGKLTVLVSPEPLPGEARDITATLAASGAMALSVDGREVLRGKTPGPLVRMPIDGLQVGQDLAGAVGPYTVPNAFGGEIKSVTVQLED